MDGPNDVNFHCNCVTLLIISSPIFVFEKLQDNNNLKYKRDEYK